VYLASDFDIFADQTLPGRLGKIRAILDPKFLTTVTDVQPQFASLEVPVYAHVARHQRRTKNPPPDSWVAWSTSKRGYKALPHVEFGLWDDRLYIWLVVLQEATDRLAVIDRVSPDLVTGLPATFKVANDHTDKLAARPLTAASYQALLADQRTQRHAEWLVGRDFLPTDDFFTGTANQQVATIQATIAALVPLYRALLTV